MSGLDNIDNIISINVAVRTLNQFQATNNLQHVHPNCLHSSHRLLISFPERPDVGVNTNMSLCMITT